MQKHDDAEVADEIVRLRKEGKRRHEIMQILKIGNERVTRALISAGLNERRLTVTEKERLFKLRDEGWSQRELAAEFGVSKNAVALLLKRDRSKVRLCNEARFEGDAVIISTKSGEITADAADWPILRGYRWLVHGTANNKYALTTRSGHRIYMHRLLMQPPAGMFVDHINHNGCDNRRSNLRVVTPSENTFNARIGKPNGLPRGVLKTRYGRYLAQVNLSAGTFKTPQEASAARIALIEKIRGAGILITEETI